MSLKFDFMLNFFIAMIAIANPIGKVPCWLEVAKQEGKGVQNRLALYLIITSLVIFLSLIWFHKQILEFFGLTVASFKVGGGVVIFLTGYAMLQGKIAEFNLEETDESDIKQRTRLRFKETLVPLAIPLIAGPGSMSTVLIYAGKTKSIGGSLSASLVIAAVLFLLYVILINAKRIEKVLGDVVLTVVTRVFGFLLTAISAQLILEGLGVAYPGWLRG